jgi:CBS domain-containing protein
MNVERLMTRNVASCRADDTLNEAARVMWEHDCGFVPIVEGDARPRIVGVVTDRDLCMAAYTRGRTLREIRIGDVMSTAVRSCRSSDGLAVAETTMREGQIHRLPVVDDGDLLLGVISLADIAREAAREARSRRHEVTATEVGETLAAILKPRAMAA